MFSLSGLTTKKKKGDAIQFLFDYPKNMKHLFN